MDMFDYAMKKPVTPEDFDANAKVAEQELTDIMSKLEMEDRHGISVFRDWWKKSYMFVGHKRLARILLAIKD
jgi:nucleoside 2-deoxyribosyltransferase